MTGRRAFLAGLTALPIATALRAADDSPRDVIRIATEGAFPPYNTLDAQGNPKGFEIDLASEICDRLGIHAEWVLNDWTSMIPDLLAGHYDAIMAGMAITPLRARRIAFSREYFPQAGPASGMFVSTHSFQSTAGALIAVQEDTIHHDYLVAGGLMTQSHPTATAALKAVTDGQADMMFGSPDFLENHVHNSNRMLTILGREEIAAGGPAIGFHPDNPALRDRFDAALSTLDANGTLDRLNDKWFKPSRDA
ncbi:transporter substrate-binding domain-containing protein [Aquicoccus sp.]|uniref:ABC transporter substrate-binding protein n=1 Tax=Aquicoccus sp. TaxID=2055851 RepID=UPI0035652518